jgi:DNA end-binding protein Ku
MARAIWSGSISFGLVNVPVGLYSATEDHTVHFSQFEEDTSDRIRNRRVNERTGKEVDYKHIVKGYDVGGGDYVIVTPEELEQAEPGRSRNIEITDFVDLADIDPIHYRSTYYLAPQGDDSTKPYSLLLEAMAASGRAGIATMVMRGKQYLVAIRPQDRVLVLQTMYFADEIRDPAEELDRLPRRQKPAEREMKLARTLIDSMTTQWDPTRYSDDYRDRVMEIIKAKRKGEGVVTEGEGEPPAQIVDLMEALQRSLDGATKQTAKSDNAKPKAEKAAGRTAEEANSTAAKQPKKQADTSEDLYQRAKQLNVKGRSKMTKEELQKAVARKAS